MQNEDLPQEINSTKQQTEKQHTENTLTRGCKVHIIHHVKLRKIVLNAYFNAHIFQLYHKDL